MFKRKIQQKMEQLLQKMPVIALTGPRQSGKSTLVQQSLPNYAYTNLEDPETRSFAASDPKAFLQQSQHGLIIDEVQHIPDLLSHIQVIVDRAQHPGQFVITGSQNFLLLKNISQSLAGRVALLHLLPLSVTEMQQSTILPSDLATLIYQGAYPRIYQNQLDPADWLPSYIQTYLEKDVRLILNIENLNAFQRFIKMCAGRVGQILNLSSLANDCGITHNTAKSWISVLEASFIVYLLQPHYRNFNKRLIKAPKLYFYDTGLVCNLLGIQDAPQVNTHYLKGALFENFILTEIRKAYFNHGRSAPMYYWRDSNGHEVDCLLEKEDRLIPIEIKAGQTITADYFKNINYWLKLAKELAPNAYVVYAGNAQQQRQTITVLGWKDFITTCV